MAAHARRSATGDAEMCGTPPTRCPPTAAPVSSSCIEISTEARSFSSFGIASCTASPCTHAAGGQQSKKSPEAGSEFTRRLRAGSSLGSGPRAV